MSRENLELSPKVTDPVKAYRDGGYVRWQVLWTKNGIATRVARASEWVKGEFGEKWVEQTIKEITAKRAALDGRYQGARR